MRQWMAWALAVSVATSTAVAQNQPSPEQIQTLYQDALNQLKAAQDRKNELATENAKLKKREAELEQQLAAANQRIGMVRQQLGQAADLNNAWADFVSLYQPLRTMWERYLAGGQVRPRMADWLDSGTWPFAVEG